ncbi:MAG: hypothetical protein M3328_09410, partial [Chloroflexota bacterium]|nr:hypothetical protein [Chloroflexota bacterium]
LYTGGASFQYPIEVPAGPGGIKPSFALSYNSSATDGNVGTREKQQSSWVGKGWSLDTGYIALNRRGSDRASSRYYTLVLNGQSYDLVRGAARVSSPSLTNPVHWEWRTTDESFLRVRAESNGFSYGGEYSPYNQRRGGYYSTGPMPRYKWQVWTPDGTRYDFEEDAWQGFLTEALDAEGQLTCDTGATFMEAYKWHLTRVEDTHSNQISYSYDRENGWRRTGCSNGVQGTVDWAVWLTAVSWGKNIPAGAGNDRHKVEFLSSSRGIDTQFDSADNQLGPAPQEKRQLNYIKVWSNASTPFSASAWQPVRQYNLVYEPDASGYLLSDNSIDNKNGTYSANTAFPKLTLKSIQQLGSDGSTALPATTFTYALARGSGYCPNGDWNRLKTVNNGQGGTLTFGYESICAATNNGLFLNHRRVQTRTATDGRGNSYSWTYTYSNPAMNTIGAFVHQDHGPNYYPNSASLWFNRFYPWTNGDLVHQPKSEFRGHSYVIERDPNGNETEHWFYQGDVGCAPDAATTGDSITNDACFKLIRDREFLKGREYRTLSRQGTVAASGAKLSEVTHNFTVNFLSDGGESYAPDRFAGLWRAYSYESETVQKHWEGNSAPVSKKTTYQYDGDTGNLLSATEYDAAGVEYRTTSYSYKTLKDASNYVLDRKRKETIRQGDINGPLLAHTIYAWDSSLGGGEALTKGELKHVRKYYNLAVPPSQSFPDVGLSIDTSYTYDDFGNQKSVTTYANYGQTTNMNTSPYYG